MANNNNKKKKVNQQDVFDAKIFFTKYKIIALIITIIVMMNVVIV